MARATKKRREKANAKGEVRQQLLKGDEKEEEEEEEEGGKGMGVKGRGGERGGGGGKEGGIEHPTARLFWAKHFECTFYLPLSLPPSLLPSLPALSLLSFSRAASLTPPSLPPFFRP